MPAFAEQYCGVAHAVLTVLDERATGLFDGALHVQPTLAALLSRPEVADNLEAEPQVRAPVATCGRPR
jgi:hypothetical protein